MGLNREPHLSITTDQLGQEARTTIRRLQLTSCYDPLHSKLLDKECLLHRP